MKQPKKYTKSVMAFSLAAIASVSANAQTVADTAEVKVAFGSKAKSELLGGISAVDMKDLTQKNYNTYSLDALQAYAGGYNGQLWNMGDALILVDGVPRDANNVNPSEIDQITFLKSASAVVLYGSRAAKGAVLITTKRGHADGLKVSVRGNVSLFTPKEYPTFLGAAQYMSLYNESLVNDGDKPAFTDTDIYNFASGRNPYRYHSNDFFSKDYLKKSYTRYEGQAEFEGGGKYAHFYAQVGFYHQGDLINFGEGKDNHTNRLNFRGNIDLRLNDWITGWVNSSASFYDLRSDRSNYWSKSATLRPTSKNALSPLLPISMMNPDVVDMMKMIRNSSNVIDGQYLIGGTLTDQSNPFADMYAAGYNTYTSRQLQFDAGIKFDLNKVLKGLSFTTQVAIDYNTSYNASIQNEYAYYIPTWSNQNGYDEIISLEKKMIDKFTANQNVSDSHDKQTIFFSGQFDWARQFNQHAVGATLLAHAYQLSNDGEYHHTSNANLGLNLNYNYAHRYYADLSMAAVHSAKLAEGHRGAISPVGTLGWRLSEEKFMEGTKGWLDDLKLTASYGVVNEDLDLEKYYMYDDIFTATGTWWGWSESANAMQTSDSQRGENVDLGFIKRKEFRFGLDASFGKGLVKLNANYFNVKFDGLVITPEANFPSYYHTYWPVSTFLPNYNYNIQNRSGFDFTVDFHKNLGEVDLQAGVTGMYVTNKNSRVSELVEYDWQKSEGARIDAIRGYQCLGFFADEADIAANATVNDKTKPGDLKYKDQNKDGKIDSKDRVVLGHWNPDFYLGFHFTAKYKGFTFFMNWTGDFGGMGLKNNEYAWCYGERKYSDMALGRWTPETANSATYPRLTASNNDLSFVDSDFWTYKTSALLLNKVQFTYDFPANMFAGKWINGLSVYVSGNSLLTIAKERKYMETNVGSAPQTRSYNLGVKVNF
ncbi:MULTISPECIES: SusC/RagA family TonB-linked outer membrane protein [Segatella]|uniref:TonB-dependent receptor domain protein n=2 Tax=Segatella TaxID=2974251 RepID=D8DVU9_9BACT|nr:MULTISPECIES: SusC/RagA family TonB-linked outer membrane protein [Segatella]EFI72441.1 TonB-dependent receptor domain protein [Segatella baroniae B14]UKK79607.1 SusC/RagA family TonB-linked outer membrane protein [Segatella baroniae B14]GJG28886.1 SusC/RagA family TonB-linked outer membrane protein [Segatella bryantii]